MKKIITAIGLIAMQMSLAQSGDNNKMIGDINKMFLPPPTANNLMKFEEVPVSYYTGIPDINIPLFNIPAKSGGVNLNVQLKYHPLSAKPNDRSGEQGLGWSLLAGGTISRTVRGGSPDEKNVNNHSVPANIKFGIYNHANNPTYLIINNGVLGANLAEYGFYAAMGKYDTEYDLYQYNFMGNAGRFIVKKDTNSNYVVEKLDKNNLRITFDKDNTTGEILSFTITDDKGIKYVFNVLEKSAKNTSVVKVGLRNQTPYVSNDFELGNYTTSYMLAQVNNQDDTNLIKFNYDLNTVLNYEESNSMTRRNQYNVWYNDEDPMQGYNVDSSLPGALESRSTYNTSQSKLLTSIEIADKGKIVFTYEQGRQDSNYTNSSELYKLKSVQSSLLNQNVSQYIKKFVMDYTYTPVTGFSPLDGPSKTLKKLLLNKVTEVSPNGQNLEQTIEYNSSSDPGLTLPLKEDDWGYYKDDAIKTDIIKSITYPTKGKVVFNFEENEYSAYPGINGDGGMKIITGYNQTTANESSVGFSQFSLARKEFFTISSPQVVRISCYYGNLTYYPWTLTLFKKTGTNQYDEVYHFDEFQQQSSSPGGLVANPYPSDVPLITERELYVQLQPGTYYTNLVNLSGSATSDLYSTFVAHTSESVFVDQKIKKGGGIRIKELSYYDSLNSSAPAKRKIYNYQDTENPLFSSGALVFPPPVHHYDDTFNLHYTKEDINGNTIHVVEYNCQLKASTNYNVLPVEKTQGSDVGYQYVTVEDVDVSNNKKGRTVYKFRSPIDFPNQTTMYTSMPIIPIPNQDYLRGQLVSEKVYDNNNRLLSENTTDYISTEYEKIDGVKIKDNFYNNMITKYYKYSGYADFVNWYGIHLTLSSPYKNFEKFGVTLPSQKTEKAYFYQNGVQSSVSTVTSNTYNVNNYPSSTTQQFADSGSNTTSYLYANEKGNQLMIDKNMIGIPLETITTQTTGSTTKTLSKIETIYPTAVPTAQAGNLVLPLSAKSYDMLNTGTSYTELTYDKYDSNGNLLQYTTKDGTPVTIIWGYNNTQPVAKIEGITYDQLITSVSPSSVISASNDDAADPSKEGLLIEALITFRKNSALADKLVTTYTYDPLIGVTSITPPSGTREIYFYDPSGRLKEIKTREKDTTGNYVDKKVKEFNYNYKQ